eukprot:1156142-Pelagomonas_calceolata.AAC.8
MSSQAQPVAVTRIYYPLAGDHTYTHRHTHTYAHVHSHQGCPCVTQGGVVDGRLQQGGAMRSDTAPRRAPRSTSSSGLWGSSDGGAEDVDTGVAAVAELKVSCAIFCSFCVHASCTQELILG